MPSGADVVVQCGGVDLVLADTDSPVVRLADRSVAMCAGTQEEGTNAATSTPGGRKR